MSFNTIMSYMPGQQPGSSFGVDIADSNALGGTGAPVPNPPQGVQMGQVATNNNMPAGQLDFGVAPQGSSQDFGQVKLDGQSAQSGILNEDYDIMSGGGSDFDYKSMVSGIAKSMSGGAGQSQQAQLKPQLGTPRGSQAAPVMLPTGINASSAMNAIQGGGMGSVIGGQPTRDQLLAKMMGN